MPPDFEKKSLAEQVDAYAAYVKCMGGSDNLIMTSQISYKGLPAAEEMIPFIEGRRSGIPPYIAMKIVGYVQERGCHLKDTPVEAAVAHFLERKDITDVERVWAKAALTGITNDSVSPPGKVDGLDDGPCERALKEELRQKGASLAGPLGTGSIPSGSNPTTRTPARGGSP